MTRTHVIRFAIASAAALGAALCLPVGMTGETARVNGAVVIPVEEDTPPIDGDAEGDATIKGIGVVSTGGQMKQRFLRAVHAGIVPNKDRGNAGHRTGDAGDDEHDVRNTQANDPALDHITTFDPAVVNTRPFEFSTQSETSAVSAGRHIVVGYNTSAGADVQFFPGFGLAFTKLMFSGVSTSHDGGRTWTSGFVPSVSPDVPFTFGDPALPMDRRGNIFYASLGTDAGEPGGIIVNKSSDHGSTFGAATVVAVDDGSDKEGMAIGPDPTA